MKQLAMKITIVIRGNTESDIQSAIEEAVRHVENGYLTGHDRNETGAYYFDVTDAVPDGELPA